MHLDEHKPRDEQSRQLCRISLLAVLMITGLLTISAWMLTPSEAVQRDAESLRSIFWLSLFLGIVTGTWKPRPYRWLGIGVLGYVFLFILVSISRFQDWSRFTTILAGLTGGISLGAFLAYRQHFFQQRWHDTGIIFSIAVLASGSFLSSRYYDGNWLDVREWLVGIGWAIGLTSVVLLLLIFRRPIVECLIEIPMRVAYRFRAYGPGLGQIPPHGPCIVIANHGAYLDPLFLAGAVDRPITPMMTAKFYDRPIIRPLMRYIFDTIRVPEVAMKWETTEVAEAIAALDAGKCLVVFPEGWLRRKEEQPLRRFGRGIWQILQARPEIPVVACWIEGSWGSYFSFKDGPPGVNKRWDFRHSITVGISEPVRVPLTVLQNHMETRRFLMHAVLTARSHMGLPPYSCPELADNGQDSGEQPPSVDAAEATGSRSGCDDPGGRFICSPRVDRQGDLA